MMEPPWVILLMVGVTDEQDWGSGHPPKAFIRSLHRIYVFKELNNLTSWTDPVILLSLHLLIRDSGCWQDCLPLGTYMLKHILCCEMQKKKKKKVKPHPLLQGAHLLLCGPSSCCRVAVTLLPVPCSIRPWHPRGRCGLVYPRPLQSQVR